MPDLPILTSDAGVILVASGYMFRCPECDALSYRTSALETRVSCDNCRAEFPVVEVRHRTSEGDIAPGVAPRVLYIPRKVEALTGNERLAPKRSQANQQKRKKAGP